MILNADKTNKISEAFELKSISYDQSWKVLKLTVQSTLSQQNKIQNKFYHMNTQDHTDIYIVKWILAFKKFD